MQDPPPVEPTADAAQGSASVSQAPAGSAPDLQAAGQLSDRRLLFFSVASAAYALLPVPLLDDHMIRSTRRKMVAEIAAAAGHQPTSDQVIVLSGTTPKVGWGCVFALAIAIPVKVTIKLVRRVFRSILFWLAIKDAVEAASSTFHDGFLVRAGLAARPAIAADGGPYERTVLWVRGAADQVLQEVDTRPFQRLIKGSFRHGLRALRVSARHLTRLRRRTAERVQNEQLEDEVPAAVVDELVDDLEEEAAVSYLQDLERRLLSHLARWQVASDAPVQASAADPGGGPSSDRDEPNADD